VVEQQDLTHDAMLEEVPDTPRPDRTRNESAMMAA
jgi:hypothetical protein